MYLLLFMRTAAPLQFCRRSSCYLQKKATGTIVSKEQCAHGSLLNYAATAQSIY
jgi:hypothetical protein